jgi:hypothetical protein
MDNASILTHPPFEMMTAQTDGRELRVELAKRWIYVARRWPQRLFDPPHHLAGPIRIRYLVRFCTFIEMKKPVIFRIRENILLFSEQRDTEMR